MLLQEDNSRKTRQLKKSKYIIQQEYLRRIERL